jgi:hypothetical protein
VYGPTRTRDRTKNNAISNDRRAKKAHITSGGAATNGGSGRGDSETIAETLGATVGARIDDPLLKTPSFTTRDYNSFADPQQISPFKAGPFPPIKPEPLQTPKKSKPAIFEGMNAHATPPNTLHDYLAYDYINCSAGQPKREARRESHATGSGMSGGQQNGNNQPTSTSEHYEEVSEYAWLHHKHNSEQ